MPCQKKARHPPQGHFQGLQAREAGPWIVSRQATKRRHLKPCSLAGVVVVFDGGSGRGVILSSFRFSARSTENLYRSRSTTGASLGSSARSRSGFDTRTARRSGSTMESAKSLKSTKKAGWRCAPRRCAGIGGGKPAYSRPLVGRKRD